MVAINDGILLDAAIYRLLRKHLRAHPAYTELLDLFHQVTYQTSHGQLLDTINTPIGGWSGRVVGYVGCWCCPPSTPPLVGSGFLA